MERIPINDTTIYALARLVDDAQKERRDPSHSDIEFQIDKHGLQEADPNRAGPPVGKAKRIRSILNWAIDNDLSKAECFSAGIISTIRASGGFRESSPNFVGTDSILDLSEVLKGVGIVLGEDGSLSVVALETLSGKNLTVALRSYVNRAKKGVEDAALLVGTSKDLMEATAAHVLQELLGKYPTTVNFPTLLGQAFVALEMKTPEHPAEDTEHPRGRLERAMYEMACSINMLRNKEGSGHGRLWLPDLERYEAITAIEYMGILSELLLDKLEYKLKQ